MSATQNLTPQQHYAEAERLMAEADQAAEDGSPFEASTLTQAATARALIALAAAASTIAESLSGERP